jgi:homoserine dehydrogenase
VLADVTRICADLSISIDAIFQKEAGEGEDQVDVGDPHARRSPRGM